MESSLFWTFTVVVGLFAFLGSFLGAMLVVHFVLRKDRDFIEAEHKLRMAAIEEGKLRLL